MKFRALWWHLGNNNNNNNSSSNNNSNSNSNNNNSNNNNINNNNSWKRVLSPQWTDPGLPPARPWDKCCKFWYRSVTICVTRREKLKLGVSVSFNSSPCVLSFDGSYLNGFGPLQIGGVENAINDLKINFTGFKGCIRNIYDDGKMYDLFNPLKEINTELGCRLNNPCPNCNGVATVNLSGLMPSVSVILVLVEPIATKVSLQAGRLCCLERTDFKDIRLLISIITPFPSKFIFKNVRFFQRKESYSPWRWDSYDLIGFYNSCRADFPREAFWK